MKYLVFGVLLGASCSADTPTLFSALNKAVSSLGQVAAPMQQPISRAAAIDSQLASLHDSIFGKDPMLAMNEESQQILNGIHAKYADPIAQYQKKLNDVTLVRQFEQAKQKLMTTVAPSAPVQVPTAPVAQPQMPTVGHAILQPTGPALQQSAPSVDISQQASPSGGLGSLVKVVTQTPPAPVQTPAPKPAPAPVASTSGWGFSWGSFGGSSLIKAVNSAVNTIATKVTATPSQPVQQSQPAAQASPSQITPVASVKTAAPAPVAVSQPANAKVADTTVKNQPVQSSVPVVPVVSPALAQVQSASLTPSAAQVTNSASLSVPDSTSALASSSAQATSEGTAVVAAVVPAPTSAPAPKPVPPSIDYAAGI